MNFLEQNVNITKIVTAMRVSPFKSTPIHNNRSSHGLAFILRPNATNVYTFSNGKIIECSYGDCIYLPKHSNYVTKEQILDNAESSKTQNTVFCINFQIDREINFSPFKLHIQHIDDLLYLYLNATRVWQNKTIGYEEMCRSFLYQIIANLKISYSKKYFFSTQKEILKPALRFIDDNFSSNKISIPDLAKLCNISESYFRKLFLSMFGVPAAVFIRRKRLALAKDLLDSGEYSATEASIMSGFNNISYFSREYKKMYGLSPTTDR